MDMTDNDDRLIAQFMTEHKPQVADMGFTRRVMRHLPQHTDRLNRYWTLFCFGSLPGRDVIEMNDDEDALTQLCRQYVLRGQCPRMMNMEKVYGRKQYVNDVAREYGADGIIYQQVKFCDPWAYERLLGSTMLREDYGFPVMSVDRPYNIASSIGQMRTRVQAFVESIEIKKLQGGAR